MQSQRCCELFSINNRNLVNNWKVHATVKKVYDDLSKTFVYCLKGKSPVPLMKWPKDKSNVPSTRPVLVFQMSASPGARILIDVGVITCGSTRRRVTLSTNLKSRKVTQLSSTLPMTVAEDSLWSHLLVDVDEAVSCAWKQESLKCIDSIHIGGAMSVRRIFAVSKDLIQNLEGSWTINYDDLPKQMSISRTIPQTYVYIICSNESAANTEESAEKVKGHKGVFSTSWLNFDKKRLAAEVLPATQSVVKPILQRVARSKSIKSHKAPGNELIREDAQYKDEQSLYFQADQRSRVSFPNVPIAFNSEEKDFIIDFANTQLT